MVRFQSDLDDRSFERLEWVYGDFSAPLSIVHSRASTLGIRHTRKHQTDFSIAACRWTLLGTLELERRPPNHGRRAARLDRAAAQKKDTFLRLLKVELSRVFSFSLSLSLHKNGLSRGTALCLMVDSFRCSAPPSASNETASICDAS